MTRKTLTRGHIAFDTCGLFWKIAVRLDSPYLQQIASKRKMPTNAVACRTGIRRSKRANYQLIDQLNFVHVTNSFFFLKKTIVPCTGLLAHCENTQHVDENSYQYYNPHLSQRCKLISTGFTCRVFYEISINYHAITRLFPYRITSTCVAVNPKCGFVFGKNVLLARGSKFSSWFQRCIGEPSGVHTAIPTHTCMLAIGTG